MMDRENNYKLVFKSYTTAAEVLAAGTETIALQPPVGYIWETIIVRIDIPDPVGSGAGDHRIELSVEGSGSNSLIGSIISNFGSPIIYKYGIMIGNTENPTAETSQFDTVERLIASNSIPMKLKYTNGTDVAQNGTRAVEFLVKQYREAI